MLARRSNIGRWIGIYGCKGKKIAATLTAFGRRFLRWEYGAIGSVCWLLVQRWVPLAVRRGPLRPCVSRIRRQPTFASLTREDQSGEILWAPGWRP